RQPASPTGLVSRWPHRARCRPPGPKSSVVTRFGRCSTRDTVTAAGSPSCRMASTTTGTTAVSSPGGFGLGAAIRRCARSITSTSTRRGASDRLTVDSLVLRRPVLALPGLELYRLQAEQPTRPVHGGFQILRTVLTEVTHAHPSRDGHPLAANVRLLDQMRA